MYVTAGGKASGYMAQATRKPKPDQNQGQSITPRITLCSYVWNQIQNVPVADKTESLARNEVPVPQCVNPYDASHVMAVTVTQDNPSHTLIPN